MRNSLLTKQFNKFQHYFPGNKENIRIFFAPGRVNLIGEHTDYNGGYVLPCALTIGTYMLLRPRKDGRFLLFSENFPAKPATIYKESIQFPDDAAWVKYPAGLIAVLREEGIDCPGADIYYYGNIPNGAGLSSSASLAMVTAYGLNSVFSLGLDTARLAHLSQKVENEFLGVASGIMDQYAVAFGKKNEALFLDCLTLEREHVPVNPGDYRLVMTNTNRPRTLANSEYNKRREECRRGLRYLQKVFPEIISFRDLRPEHLEALKIAPRLQTIYRRLRHVISENKRVLEAVKNLKDGNLNAFGKQMQASHLSLKNDYEVTGPELDTLFSIQKEIDGCIGTRMTGAGFGGCTVSLVHKNRIDAFTGIVTEKYVNQTGLRPTFYMAEIGDGVRELEKVLSSEN